MAIWTLCLIIPKDRRVAIERTRRLASTIPESALQRADEVIAFNPCLLRVDAVEKVRQRVADFPKWGIIECQMDES